MRFLDKTVTAEAFVAVVWMLFVASLSGLEAPHDLWSAIASASPSARGLPR
jgi:hypothetical protein